MLRLALPAALLATGCVIHLDRHTDSDEVRFAGPIAEIHHDLAAGDIDIRVGDVDEVVVTRAWSWAGDRPDVSARVVGDVLVLTVECYARPFDACAVHHEVVVPAAVVVDGATGSGDVTIVGQEAVAAETGSGDVRVYQSGTTTVTTGSGHVELDEIAGELTVNTGSGDIVATDLFTTHAWLATGSGDIDVESEVAPAVLSAATSSGHIVLELPPGAYDLVTHTGSGAVDVTGITVDHAAESRVDLETGSGDVRVFAE